MNPDIEVYPMEFIDLAKGFGESLEGVDRTCRSKHADGKSVVADGLDAGRAATEQERVPFAMDR
jgi:hypothetical protein